MLRSLCERKTKVGTVAVVGSSNVDIQYSLTRHPAAGETVIGSTDGRLPGGKGFNQAMAAHRAGAATQFRTRVGDDESGRFLRDCARANGLDDSYFSVDACEPTGVAHILRTSDGENAIIVIPGANARFEASPPLDADVSVVLAQREVPDHAIVQSFADARAVGAVTVLNAAPSHAVEGDLLRVTDIVIVNEHEADELGGADSILRQGPELVVVTQGSQGVEYRHRSGVREFIPSYPITAVDTTGAGDAFCGAFAAAVRDGEPVATAVRRGAAAGAITATQVGAQSDALSSAAIDRIVASGQAVSDSSPANV